MFAPYSQVLSLSDVLHLMRRLSFSVDWKIAQGFVGKNSDAVIDGILNAAQNPPALTKFLWLDIGFPSFWKFSGEERQRLSDDSFRRMYQENYELKREWMKQMTVQPISFADKMALFWHGHFTTKFAIDDLFPASLMYKQLELFRNFHQGNLRLLIESIIEDGAMLVYLNGKDNTKNAPNENFSRELLELYTTGIGHYSEDDVKEGARVFTGWKVNIFTEEWQSVPIFKSFVFALDHDFGDKIYLGETIRPSSTLSQENAVKDEVKQLVDIILRKKSVEVSTFIAAKLFRYFVYSNSRKEDDALIAQLASKLRSSNWEIRPVLDLLFKSQFFFSEKVKGVQIKTPSETVVGITKHFDVKEDWKEWVMLTMGQELLNPPNVAGWPGYRKWMDTRTLPFAIQQMSSFIWSQTNVNMVNWVKQFQKPEDVNMLLPQILSLFFAKEPTTAQILKYKQELLGLIPEYEWPNMLETVESAAFRLKLLMVAIFKSPDFHLC